MRETRSLGDIGPIATTRSTTRAILRMASTTRRIYGEFHPFAKLIQHELMDAQEKLAAFDVSRLCRTQNEFGAEAPLRLRRPDRRGRSRRLRHRRGTSAASSR